ncbi:unnamed protein product, partial [Cladocopium goreaui]
MKQGGRPPESPESPEAQSKDNTSLPMARFWTEFPSLSTAVKHGGVGTLDSLDSLEVWWSMKVLQVRMRKGQGPSFENEEPVYLPPLRVTAPRPRQPGGTEFYGAVPKHSATFAWSELCATPDPEGSLAPVPQVPMKSWYNSYVYVPEQNMGQDRQYLTRFAKGPNGEWVDVVKARQLLDAMDAAQQRQMREEMEREMVLSGMSHLGDAVEADGQVISGIQRTHYVDPYSGEKLIACKGQLQTREEILSQYHIRGAVLPPEEWFDFDNLRFPWPFAKHDPNKPVSQHTFDWFDRRNVYIPK